MIILRILCKFLHELIKYEDQNKMTSMNLSIVFAPNLLRPEGHQIGLMLTDSAYSTGLMKTLIEYFDFLFEDANLEEETPQELIPGSRDSINRVTDVNIAKEEIKRLTINLKESPILGMKPTPPPRKPSVRPAPPQTLMNSQAPQHDPFVRRASDLAPPPSTHARSQSVFGGGTSPKLPSPPPTRPWNLRDPLPEIPPPSPRQRPLPSPQRSNSVEEDSKSPTHTRSLSSDKKVPPPPVPKKPSQIAQEEQLKRGSMRGALPQVPYPKDDSFAPSTKLSPPIPGNRTNRTQTTFAPYIPKRDDLSNHDSPKWSPPRRPVSPPETSPKTPDEFPPRKQSPTPTTSNRSPPVLPPSPKSLKPVSPTTNGAPPVKKALPARPVSSRISNWPPATVSDENDQ